MLRFTTDTAIWPASNISERGVRPLKARQKISGRLASDVTQDRRGIANPCIVCRQRVMRDCCDAGNGEPPGNDLDLSGWARR